MTTIGSSLLHTRLCDLLGIRYPICQAGMAFVARSGLAAAVSEAGGLGVLAAAHSTPAELRAEIRRVRERTDKPFGVDILFATVAAAGDEGAAVGPEGAAAGPEVKRFTDAVRGAIDVALEERVPVLVAGLGNPGPVTADAHRLGIKIMALCGNVKQARDHAQNGVDVVIAQGHEAGGHTGRVGGLVLVPAVVDAVAPRPVVAAGGVADGRGLLAALALGADGIWMGTRFITTVEAHGHDNYKRKIVAIDEEGTVVTRASSGKPCRLIRNAFTRQWDARTAEIQPFPIQYERVGRPSSIRAREDGDVENGAAAAGQSSALIHEIRPVREMIEAMVADADRVLARISALRDAGPRR